MKTRKKYTIDEQDKIGGKLAEILCLRKDKKNKERWQTTWGNKTNIGIFNTIIRFGSLIETGEIEHLTS